VGGDHTGFLFQEFFSGAAREESMTRPSRMTMTDQTSYTLVGGNILEHSARTRLLFLFALALAIVAAVAVLFYKGIKTTSLAAAEKLRLAKKTPVCYSDEECPNGTFCSDGRLCVPSSALPPLAPPLIPIAPVAPTKTASGVAETLGRALDHVLGRGRGGEGAEVQLTSTDQKGQDK
jgi:hypothetical protein